MFPRACRSTVRKGSGLAPDFFKLSPTEARDWRGFHVVAYKHGMRASEVCNLRLDDVDVLLEFHRPKRRQQVCAEVQLVLRKGRVLQMRLPSCRKRSHRIALTPLLSGCIGGGPFKQATGGPVGYWCRVAYTSSKGNRMESQQVLDSVSCYERHCD